ncbi:Bmx [Scenedesmus sp. PABB004]|nr:Bmx [Scenedesmus sp. PABB004]
MGRPAPLLLLLLAAAASRAAAAAAPRSGSLVDVPQDVEQPVILQAMLNASVSGVLFTAPAFDLVEEAWQFITPSTPLYLDRNFSVTSAASPPTVIDFHNLARRVVLEQGVEFTFADVVLRNIGGEGVLDAGFFLPAQSAGGAVVLRNVTLLNALCTTPPDAALAAARAAPRPRGAPPNAVRREPRGCVALPGGGGERCVADALVFERFAALGPLGGSGGGPGYALRADNVTSLCESYVDPECLRTRSEGDCWAEGLAALAARGAAPRRLGAGAAAGVAVGGAAALAAAAGGCALCARRRRRRRRQAVAAAELAGTKGGPDSSHSGKRSSFDSASLPYSGPRLSSVTHRGAAPSNIRLGVLIGAGSFGRVLRGRFYNHEAAIKIINCSRRELPRVLRCGTRAPAAARRPRWGRAAARAGGAQPSPPRAPRRGREAEIMMKLQHPHVLRALACQVVHGSAARVHDADATSGGAPKPAGSASSSGAAGPPGGRSTDSSLHARPPAGQRTPDATGGSSGRARLMRRLRASLAAWRDEDAGGLPGGRATPPGQPAPPPATPPQPPPATPPQPPPGAGGGDGSWALPQLPPDHSFELDEEAAGEGLGSLPPPDAFAEEQLEVWLVLELCNGSLQDVAKRPADTLDLMRLLHRLREVAEGMAFLHSKNCVHGDLKAANVLLKNDINAPHGQSARISDFGLASTLLEGATHRSTATVGTISHTAPEVLTSGRQSPAADVYSYGIMMWELFAAAPAFSGHYGNVVRRVVSGERPPPLRDAPDEYNLLVSRCVDAAPEARPSFEQVAACLDLLIEGLAANSGANAAAGCDAPAPAPAPAHGPAQGPAAAPPGSSQPGRSGVQQGAGSAGSSWSGASGLVPSRHVKDL